MEPEQFVAQLAELRTQNQQLHQALQQVQQQQSQQQQEQSQQQSLIQALSDLPQSLAQTVGSAVLAAANPARTNPTLVDTKGLGKPPPLKNTESEFVSWARRTENFVVSVHPGARDVLTWAVEKESATVAEANAATEVVMPPDTLRMLADQLYTVLMTLVEGESFDILVGSGSGEGLEAWRRLQKRWDPLTTGRARGLLREILSPGRAKLVELQGAVERLEDLMRRYTQRRDARNGQRHTLAEDIRMAALEALLPEELERHGQLQRSRLDTYQKLREEVVLYAEARGYVAPKLGQVSKAREDRDDPMDVGGFGQWKGRNFPKGKGKNSTGTGKGKGTGKRWKGWCEIIRTSEHTENSKSVLELRENKSPVQGLLGEPWQMATATESRTFKFSWKGKRCEGQTRQRWWKERKIQRCWTTCVESTAESSSELSGIVYTTDRHKHNGWHG